MRRRRPPSPAWADKINHPTAVFSGLDKITGRILSFEAAIGETVQFGTLQITPRVCYSRPPTDAPRTDVFAEVDDVQADKSVKRIFTGWMFADSPGLHGIEHPVYDLWLTECKGDGPLIHEEPEVADAPPDAPDADQTQNRASPTDAASPDAKPQHHQEAEEAESCGRGAAAAEPRRPGVFLAALRAAVAGRPAVTTRRRFRPPTSPSRRRRSPGAWRRKSRFSAKRCCTPAAFG